MQTLYYDPHTRRYSLESFVCHRQEENALPPKGTQLSQVGQHRVRIGMWVSCCHSAMLFVNKIPAVWFKILMRPLKSCRCAPTPYFISWLYMTFLFHRFVCMQIPKFEHRKSSAAASALASSPSFNSKNSKVGNRTGNISQICTFGLSFHSLHYCCSDRVRKVRDCQTEKLSNRTSSA